MAEVETTCCPTCGRPFASLLQVAVLERGQEIGPRQRPERWEVTCAEGHEFSVAGEHYDVGRGRVFVLRIPEIVPTQALRCAKPKGPCVVCGWPLLPHQSYVGPPERPMHPICPTN
jgi:hypothetical protein